MKRIVFIIVMVYLSGGIWCFAQNDTAIVEEQGFIYFDPLQEGIERYLPPVQQMIDSAMEHSPLLKYQNSARVIAQLNIQSVRREWSKHLGIISDARYGLFEHLVLAPDDAGDFQARAVPLTQQMRYSAGFYVKLPLQELYSRSNNIEIAREKEKMAQYEYETEKMNLRKLVIQQYSDLITAQKVLRVKNELVQDVVLQREMAERQFKSNEIDISDMTRLNTMYSKAKTEFVEAKGDFNLAYLMLQEITGIKFKIKIKENP